jgi:hypothetical protein
VDDELHKAWRWSRKLTYVGDAKYMLEKVLDVDDDEVGGQVPPEAEAKIKEALAAIDAAQAILDEVPVKVLS